MCEGGACRPPVDAALTPLALAVAAEFDAESPSTGAPGPAQTEAASPVARRQLGRKRLKLWQIDAPYHCTIVGTCLTPEQLRKAELGTGHRMPPGLAEYEQHGIHVANARTENPLSVRMHKLLDRRHSRWIAATRSLDSVAALRQWWDARLAEGVVAGPYWALMSHPLADDELRSHAFGEVHMLGHAVCATTIQQLSRSRRALDSLADARRELDRARDALAEARAQCRAGARERTCITGARGEAAQGREPRTDLGGRRERGFGGGGAQPGAHPRCPGSRRGTLRDARRARSPADGATA